VCSPTPSPLRRERGAGRGHITWALTSTCTRPHRTAPSRQLPSWMRRRLGLSAIALTDHDFSERACERDTSRVQPRGLRVSQVLNFLPTCRAATVMSWATSRTVDHPPFATWLLARRETRVARGEDRAPSKRRTPSSPRSRAPQASWESVAAGAPISPGRVGRAPHVADGWWPSVLLLAETRRSARSWATAWRETCPRPRWHPVGVISVIREAGGVAVLAHPTYLPDFACAAASVDRVWSGWA
jgi:hypothetical protein